MARDNGRGGGGLITFEISGGRLACCAIVDLGPSGDLLLGRADYLDGRERAWLARVGPTGQVAWSGHFGVEERQSGLAAGLVTDDGDVYVVGHASGITGSRDQYRSFLLLAKTRPDGSAEWTKTFSLGLDTKAESAIVSKAGAIIVAGFARRSGNDGSIFLASFDRSGDLLWHRPIVEASEAFELRIRELAAGGYLVGGMFGLIRVEPDGRPMWHHQGLQVVADPEEIGGEIYVLGSLPYAKTRAFGLRRLSSEGAEIATRQVLKDLCWVAGAWLSGGARMMVAGPPCDRDGELHLSELSDGGERTVGRITLAKGASAYRARRSQNEHLVAAGLYTEDSPHPLQGWFFRSPRRLPEAAQ